MIAASNVIRLSDYREPDQPGEAPKSQYEMYPLSFFSREKLSCWNVQPTGNYTEDCETGRKYAIEFLKMCQDTNAALMLRDIVVDMIGAGPVGSWPDGGTRVNGIVIGFMGKVEEALNVLRALPIRVI